MSRDNAGESNSTPSFPRKEIISDPEARLKSISDFASKVEVDPNFPPHRYYRSGVEMLRMATVYQKEGNLEYAFTIYMKYLTIFIEKIRHHPKYNTIPAKDKLSMQENLRQVLPIVEELKKKLLEQFKLDAIKYAEHQEQLKNKPATDDEDKKLNVQLPNDTDKPMSLEPRKQGLRKIIVPTKIIREFLILSYVNTMNNKETCGILAGKLEKDQLSITHLLIPKQSGSSDSCVTHNEEEIFDYQDQHNLITLGWIHTHPTQTAFLSSVDLHTHCSYQLMMAEAIAIVVAPKYDETGYFILTPEHGLNFIAQCRATGFHPHPNEKSLYTHAQHCKFDATAGIQVIDLRAK
ncbi:STAM-binding protein-like A [Chelonus insularis]|uniref:STAM-binding protein-like A n=1 Tax=Chelonus insularis TaxID=460826 RepID=UPI00158EACBE|nr:STAM-binding protein-like A [Chelonus insularis]